MRHAPLRACRFFDSSDLHGHALTFLSFPSLDARKVSSNNMLERLNKEIRRRTRVVGIFPNPESYLRLVTVYLMEYSEDWSVTRAYLSEESLQSLSNQAA